MPQYGSTVKVTGYKPQWKNYEKTVGKTGVIVGPESTYGNYPVAFADIVNEHGANIIHGIFWISKRFLEDVSGTPLLDADAVAALLRDVEMRWQKETKI